MTEVYRIPRLEVAADIAMAGGPARRMTLFLAPQAELHSGPERPSDLLNGGQAFVPAVEKGKVTFLNLAATKVVSVPAEAEFGMNELEMLDAALMQATHRRLQVHFADGTVLHGDLTYVLPEGQRRLQDYLNGPDTFLVLRDGIYARLVHKQHILWLTES